MADFVEEGARLVVKLTDEIEAMAHVAELTAQEAEDLALKVEAKTKIVKHWMPMQMCSKGTRSYLQCLQIMPPRGKRVL